MKSVFIIYNQALNDRVEYMLETLEIRGYSQFADVQGRGSKTGEPRKGTPTWPEMNSGIMTIVPDEKVTDLLEFVKKLDQINTDSGVRAFVWNIEQSY